MLIDSPALYTVQTEFEDDIFFDICRIVFGINPEAVEDDNLRRAIFHAICDRFIGITIADIQTAFSRYEPKEKVYVLSRKDFIDPIAEYWKKKSIILLELKSEMDEQLEESMVEQKKIKFRKEAEDMYRQSLIKGDWIGSQFHAAVLARDYVVYFKQEEKKKLSDESFREWKEANAKKTVAIESGTDAITAAMLIPEHAVFYSVAIMKESVKQSHNQIIE